MALFFFQNLEEMFAWENVQVMYTVRALHAQYLDLHAPSSSVLCGLLCSSSVLARARVMLSQTILLWSTLALSVLTLTVDVCLVPCLGDIVINILRAGCLSSY